MNICKQCGKEFEPRTRKSEKFCSEKCKNKWHNNTYHKRQRIHKQCLVCGEKLTGKNKKYCSNACRIKAQTKAHKEEYKKPEGETMKPEKEKPKYTLAQIEALARAEGLKYGEYVAKYGL